MCCPGNPHSFAAIDCPCPRLRNPTAGLAGVADGGELPDTAAESILPQADWVFITASSIANKTLPRLLTLSARAHVVLMGPSVPWLDNWQAYGVDYVAGVAIKDPEALSQTLMEGGGTRIFSQGVGYCVYATGRVRGDQA